MKVSVLVPVYNREEFIQEALESVVVQTYPNWEVVVYDDGSTDRTREVISVFLRSLTPDMRSRFQLFRSPKNQGHGMARKTVVNASQTEWNTWLDSDDRLHPRRLELQVEAITKNNYDVCFSALQFFGNRNKIRQIDISRWRPNAPTLHFAIHNNTNTATAVGNRKAFDLVLEQAPIDHGGWDTIWSWHIIQSGCKIGYIPQPLYLCRQHKDRLVRRKGSPEWQKEQHLIRSELLRLKAPGLEFQ